MCDMRLTLSLDHELNEALLVVALSDHVHEDVVLLPKTVDLVVLVFDDCPAPMPRDGLLHVLLLGDVFRLRVRERCS